MANLNTKTISAGVGDILCVDGGISGDKQIKDGDGTSSNLFIDGTNLGIGHATPTHYLDVKGSATQPVKIESTGAYCTLDMRDAYTSDFTGLYVNGGRLSLYTGDNSRLSILSNGNVGIGTDSPGTKLDVQGSGLVSQAVRSTDDHCTFHIQAGTSGVTSDKLAYLYMGNIGGSNNGVIKYHNNTTGADRTMEFQLNGTTPLTLVGEGRVGIGTSTPSSKLQVVGSSYFNGPIRFGKTNKTISGGTIDVTSTEGPFIAIDAQTGTSDDLDFITIDGGTPPVGTTLFLTRVGGDVITVRTYNQSSVTDSNNYGFFASACDDFNEAETVITSLIIDSTYKHIQVIYNGKWSVVDPLITRCNTGE